MGKKNAIRIDGTETVAGISAIFDLKMSEKGSKRSRLGDAKKP